MCNLLLITTMVTIKVRYEDFFLLTCVCMRRINIKYAKEKLSLRESSLLNRVKTFPGLRNIIVGCLRTIFFFGKQFMVIGGQWPILSCQKSSPQSSGRYTFSGVLYRFFVRGFVPPRKHPS